MGPSLQSIVETLLARADIRVNGDRSWDITVHDPRFFRRLLGGGSLAFGESYMDGWWDCVALDELVTRLLAADLDRAVRTWRAAIGIAAANPGNFPSRVRAVPIRR